MRARLVICASVVGGLALVIGTLASATAQPDGAPPRPPADGAPPPPPADGAGDQVPAAAASNERCAIALDGMSEKPLDEAKRGAGCRWLAEHIIDVLENAKLVPGAAAEPTMTDTVNGQDSAAQTSAVPSGQPVSQAGGTVALAGVPGTGLQMVTSLAVNPLGLASGEDDDGEDDGDIDPAQWKSYAWGSRLGDVSLILPMDLDAAGAVKEGFQYYGVRARFDLVTAIWNPDDHADEVEKAFKASNELGADYVTKVKALLEATSTPGECAEALIADDQSAEKESCGEAVERASADEAHAKARAALARFREHADSAYGTVELRLDRGDVNGDAAPSRDTLFAGYASVGYRLVNGKRVVALRGRGGVGYFKDGLTQTDRAVYYIAGALELSLLRGQGKFVCTVGAETQRVKDEDGMPDPANTTFTNIRVGLGVPLADGKQLSIGIAFPDDGGEPQLTVSGDWALLFGQ